MKYNLQLLVHSTHSTTSLFYNEVLFSGRNKTAIQPIQPRMGSVLIGVNAIRHISDLKFMCTICNIKFDIKPGRSEKHHVNGRLHKIKALVAVHGEIIDQYLQYRSKKDGYENLNAIINEACIPVEKIEKENESQENRGIRAMLLGMFYQLKKGGWGLTLKVS